MRLPRPSRHVIFDMDGVLLDTEQFYTDVTQAIVGRYGKVFDWSVKSHMVGRPAIESARHLVKALELPITPEAYLEEREIELLRLAPESAPMAGAVELTRALRRAGAVLAVATSSTERFFAAKTQRHRAWFESFSVVVLGDDPRVRRGKPAPDIFEVAARDLGVPPASCVVIEDSPAGVDAARTAGMQVIALPDPGMDATRLAHADLVVQSLSELSPEDFGLPGHRVRSSS
jgi:pseudouridine 5'-phosphatase